MKKIYNAFSFFNYKFVMNIPFLDTDNYSLKLIKFLENEKNLRKSIIDCILRQKSKKIDVFDEIIKNNRNHLNQADVGLISVIQSYVSELFTDNLTQFVFKSEKDHFLSTFLFNKLYHEYKLDEIKRNEINEKKIKILL
jgi:cellobiose-specific phosphotransferase system component IIA